MGVIKDDLSHDMSWFQVLRRPLRRPSRPRAKRPMNESGDRLRAAGSTVAHVRIVAAYRRLSRSVLPMDPVHARGGITES